MLLTGRTRHRISPWVLLLGIFLAATGAMLVGFWMGSGSSPGPKRRVQVTIVNVGNGEAAWIRTPEDRFIVIGGGPPEAGPKVAASLQAAGARRVDLLILPYPYAEAIGGVPAVLQAFPVDLVLGAGYKRVNQKQDEVDQILQAQQVPVQVARAGQVWKQGSVRIEVLAPSEPLLTATPGAANNSAVVRVVFERTTFLFAGGIEQAGEVALLGRAPNLAADWLRVARFGTRTATQSEFLRLARPSLAVISVAGGNAQGFPHRETLERLQAAGVRVLRTDQQKGDLHFWSDGFRVEESEPATPF